MSQNTLRGCSGFPKEWVGTADAPKHVDVSGWFSGTAGDQVLALHANGLTLDT
jgi:hypothetical protein